MDSGLFDNRGWPVSWFSPRPFLCLAIAALRLRAALWTSQLRWPAWSNERHVCLRECGPFPRARILRLACWAIFLRERLPERVRRFLFRALSTSCVKRKLGVNERESNTFCRRGIGLP